MLAPQEILNPYLYEMDRRSGRAGRPDPYRHQQNYLPPRQTPLWRRLAARVVHRRHSAQPHGRVRPA